MDMLARGLKDRFEPSFLIASNASSSVFEVGGVIRHHLVRHIGHAFSMPIAPGFPFRLAKLAHEHDMIALHMPFPLADLATWFGSFAAKPLVVHWHSEIVRQRGFRWLYDRPVRATLARADAVIVSGDRLLAGSPYLKAIPEKCHAIPFGVDTGLWNGLSQEERLACEETRRKHPRLVLGVGRLVSYKGFHVLIEAMRDVDGELWIAGDGPLSEFLKERAGGMLKSGKVRFLGRVERSQLKHLYHSAAVFAFSPVTEAEAFGLVQLEAMCCGLPVVNTALATEVPIVARDGIEAVTVSPEDAGALSAALSALLDDPQRRAAMGAAGWQRAREEYDAERFVQRVGDIYTQALAARQPS